MDHSTNDGSTEETDGMEQQQQRRVKILLADEHTMFREGLAGMLTSSYGDRVEVVGKTGTGEDALALAREKKPDVLIMQVDEAMHKAKDTLKRLREDLFSPPRVIILTMFDDPLLVREIMKLGASAYIHKSASVEELFSALRSTATLDTAQGENVVITMPQRALELSEDGVGKDGVRSILSPRELEVLLLAARGMSNRTIATHLFITEATVKRHLANLYPKIGVGSRGEAIRIALEKEWFTIHEITANIENL